MPPIYFSYNLNIVNFLWFETNVFGVLRTIYAALPELEKTGGNLVLVSSVAGWVAAPGISAYAMSTFAVRALAGSIA